MRVLPFLLLAGFALVLITGVEADEGPGPQVAVVENYYIPTFSFVDDDEFHQIGVAVADGYAYVFSNNQLVAVNVSDPANPTYAGNYLSFDQIYDVVLLGNYAYVAAGYDGLVVVNVSDPTNLTEVGHYNNDYTLVDVAVADGYAYVAANSNGLVVVNVNDPTNLTEVGHYFDYDDVRGVVVSGGYAYIYAHYNEFLLVDVSDPTNPTYVGNFYTALPIYGIVVADNYAYVITSGGLVVANVNDPANPTYVESYYSKRWKSDYNDTYYSTDSYAQGVAVSGGYAYII